MIALFQIQQKHKSSQWSDIYSTWHANAFNNIATKVMQFQLGNSSMSAVCSIILWTHADDAMKPLKCYKAIIILLVCGLVCVCKVFMDALG